GGKAMDIWVVNRDGSGLRQLTTSPMIDNSPRWSPNGTQIAFVSDRTGVSNVYLYDFGDEQIYQITDLFTGVQGITPLSPVLSWAHGADRLAFVYYARDMFDVYTMDNPRGRKQAPWAPPMPARETPSLAVTPPAPDSAAARADSASGSRALESSGSIYVTQQGFRQSDTTPAIDSLTKPISVIALMDSTDFVLPDTAEFTTRKYKVSFQPDYVSRPTIGYTRDNFGRGFYGGSAIQLSDMLGNHSLIFAAFINGRVTEAFVNATYVNQSRRLGWAVSVGQEPYYFLEPSRIIVDSPAVGENTLETNVRRIVSRSISGFGYYPLNRFQRIEFGLTAAAISDRLQQIREPYDPNSGFPTDDPSSHEINLDGANYAMPSAALVFDNSLPGYVSPFYGRRWRLQASQAVGGWRFFEGLVDYRRYDKIIGPITFATRGLYFGRIGRDAERFRVFLGNTDLLRGNTSGSYYRNECQTTDLNTETGCIELDRLVGTQLAVGSAEIRFPILTPQFRFVPNGVPPIEGALFYDVGVTWNEGDNLKWKRDAKDDPIRTRTPLQTLGASVRMNLFGFAILRLDYSIPQERRAIKGYWTLSLGPVF
ncbi:MAG TPA: BamA/TamA family outer membrane protein, partial [Gemmatimonadales bacterium]|nr:BamA/TamA family outer membrane protein [Gemmatimonadales bacterium]